MRDKSIRRILMERRSQLLARYRDEIDRADEELELREPEYVEHSSEHWDAQVLLKLGDTDVIALGQIVTALHRLDAGTYGDCVECGTAITAARLAALPATATCIDCAATLEPSGRSYPRHDLAAHAHHR